MLTQTYLYSSLLRMEDGDGGWWVEGGGWWVVGGGWWVEVVGGGCDWRWWGRVEDGGWEGIED